MWNISPKIWFTSLATGSAAAAIPTGAAPVSFPGTAAAVVGGAVISCFAVAAGHFWSHAPADAYAETNCAEPVPIQRAARHSTSLIVLSR